MITTTRTPVAIAVATSIFFSGNLHAENIASTDEGLERIVVTTQKRVQSIQDIPTAVMAISGDDINAQQVGDLLDLSESLPNVHLTETSSSKRIFIRGIGSGTNSGFEQSVAMYKDGIYMGRGHQAKFPLLDVERLELVKGAQSVMFGKNATAGAISITSNLPDIDSDEIEGSLDISYGTDKDTKVSGVINLPVNESFSLRLAAFSESRDGYLYNVARDQDEIETKSSGIRISGLWNNDENLSILAQIEHANFDAKGSRYQYIIDEESRNEQVASDPTNPGNVGYRSFLLSDTSGLDYTSYVSGDQHPGGLDEFSDTTLTNAFIKLTYDWQGFEVVAQSSYSEYSWDSIFDADYSELSLIKQTYIEDFEQFTQEFRISSPTGQTLEYMAGVYYQSTELSHPNDILLGASLLIPNLIGTSLGTKALFEQDQKAYSAFAALNWHMTDAWQLNLGLRFQHEEKDVTNTQEIYALFAENTPDPVKQFATIAAPAITASLSGAYANQLAAEREEDHWSPNISLQYKGFDNTMLFASYGTGYKGGGFDGSGLNSSQGNVISPDSGFEYDDEKATSFEIGVKSEVIERVWELNATLFHTEYEDLQVSEFNGNAFVVANAAATTVQGLEIETRWAISDNWQIQAQFALLDFEYDSYTSASPTVRQAELLGMASQDLSGQTGAFSPDYSGNISLDFQEEVGDGYWLDASIQLTFMDDHYLEQDLDPITFQSGYEKLNARLALTTPDENWHVALLVKNLTDKQTFSQANDVPVMSYAHRFLTEPGRELFVQASYRF